MNIYNYKFLHQSRTVPNSLLGWINHPYSLTDKLYSLTLHVELELLSQQWVKPSWWDRYGLQIHSSALFQREIIMYSSMRPYWYARTLIPQECYEQNATFFKRLEQESLRNLIFENNEVHRVHRIFYPIDKTCIEYYWIKKYLIPKHELFWARLTEYSYHRHSFYLIELLFPELGEIGA